MSGSPGGGAHRGRPRGRGGRGYGRGMRGSPGRGRGTPNGPTYNQHPSLRRPPPDQSVAMMQPSQPYWGHPAPAWGMGHPSPAASFVSPPSALLAATTFALSQGQPTFGNPYAVPVMSPPSGGYGAVAGHPFMPYGVPTPYHTGMASAPVASTSRTPFAPQVHPNAYGPRFTEEGYTLSESAGQNWNEEPIDEREEPYRKRPRLNEHDTSIQSYRCQPCRRDFRSENELSGHQRQHVRCSEPGCSFEAHPRAVEIHEEDRHLRFKPGKKPEASQKDGPPGATIAGLGIALNDPDQIAQWVAERKKRWPSATTVAEKERQRLERVAAGLEPAGRPSFRGSGRGRGGRGGARHAAESRPQHRSQAERKAEAENEGGSDSDGTGTDGPPDELPLAGRHDRAGGNDGEGASGSDVDPVADAIASKNVDEAQAHAGAHHGKIQRTCKYWARGQCRSGGECRYLHSRPDPSQPRKTEPIPAMPEPPREADLMSKLLANDIAHEVSGLLQIVHFLVDNDFLDDVELEAGEADERFIEVLPEGAPTAHAA